MPADFSLTTAQVRAAQAGDRDALDQLFARYLPRVTRIAAARLGRNWNELALDDDIAQETFLDAFVALREGRISNDGAFCNWLARCIENNVRDQIRQGRADKRGRGSTQRFADTEHEMLWDSLLEGDEPTPSQHATAHETEAKLEDALSRLDPRYREVICLRAYCRMSYSEIAATMGIPSENTANVLFLRAKAELQRRLGD